MIQKLGAILVQPSPEAALAVRRASKLLKRDGGAGGREWLDEVASELENGRAVVVRPHPDTIAVPQAAEIVNVSQPILQQLLDEGEIGFCVEGQESRVYLSDAIFYALSLLNARLEALRELQRQAQELDMGY